MASTGKPVAVVVGATSKWQADGRNTKLVHGGEVDDSDLPVGIRWGIGGAVAQKFAAEGFRGVQVPGRTPNIHSDEWVPELMARYGLRLIGA